MPRVPMVRPGSQLEAAVPSAAPSEQTKQAQLAMAPSLAPNFGWA